MPIRTTAATGWRHDNLETQKEFERIGKQLSQATKSTTDAKIVGSPFGQVGTETSPDTQGQTFEQDLSVKHNSSIVSEKIVKTLNFIDTRLNYIEGVFIVPTVVELNETRENASRSEVSIKINAHLSKMALLKYLKTNGLFSSFNMPITIIDNETNYDITDYSFPIGGITYDTVEYVSKAGFINSCISNNRVVNFVINGINYRIGFTGMGFPAKLEKTWNSDGREIFTLIWQFTKANGGFDLLAKYKTHIEIS